MKLDNEVRSAIYDLLEGGSVDRFEEWFVGTTWDDRTPLVAAVDHLLVERDMIGNAAFIDALKEVVRTINVEEAPALATSAASSTTIRDHMRTSGSETIIRRLEFAGR